MTEDSEKAILVSVKKLEQVTCIQYFIAFPIGITQNGSALDLISAVFDLSSEINAMHLAFVERLGFVVQTTKFGDQKIDSTTFEIYREVIAAFLVPNQADRVRFFEETFLVAIVSPDMVFGMPFLTLSDANVDFPKKELRWRFYTIKEALPTTKRIELVGKKEFAAAALDPRYETFIVYVAFFERPSSTQEGDVYPSCRAQIAALVANEALTSILTEHSDFANVISPKLALKLPKHIWINDHAIKLVDD